MSKDYTIFFFLFFFIPFYYQLIAYVFLFITLKEVEELGDILKLFKKKKQFF